MWYHLPFPPLSPADSQIQKPPTTSSAELCDGGGAGMDASGVVEGDDCGECNGYPTADCDGSAEREGSTNEYSDTCDGEQDEGIVNYWTWLGYPFYRGLIGRDH